MDRKTNLWVFRIGVMVVLVLNTVAFYKLNPFSQYSILLRLPYKLRVFTGLGMAALVQLELLALVFSFILGGALIFWAQEALLRSVRRLGWLNAPLFLAFSLVYPLLLIRVAKWVLVSNYSRLSLFLGMVLVGSVLLMGLWKGKSWGTTAVLTVLVYALVYKLAAYLPGISNYPLSLSWSEGSMFYEASLFFSKRVYGVALPWPVFNPAQRLLTALPFLLGNLPIAIHRFWQFFLWVSITLLTAGALAWRLKVKGWLTGVFFIVWAYFYITQAPVYYHLLLCVLVVILGFDRRHFWRTLFVVLLASAWAGLSRVNWYPLPGLLASFLYLLETPFEKDLRAYLWKPVAWTGLGLLFAFASDVVYIRLSGNPFSFYTTAYTSAMLWYRLFPNINNRLGVLLDVIWVSLPAWILLWRYFTRARASWHGVRLLGLASILLLFFAGGLLVSAKIGGGSDIHNLDAYVILTLILVGYLYFDKAAPDLPVSPPAVPGWLTAFLVVLPAMIVLISTNAIVIPNQAHGQEAVDALREVVQEGQAQGKPVLFLTQRHLLTFHLLGDAQVVNDYEKLLINDMALAGNQSYLDRYYDDLSDHRFSYVITDTLLLVHQDPSDKGFAEENNVWVEDVAIPLHQYYQTRDTLGKVYIDVLQPNP